MYKAIATAFPDIATYTSMGKSYLNRDIMVLTIGNPQATGSSVMINSLHHSRELVTTSQNSLMVLYLLRGYVQDDPAIVKYLQTHKLYSIPAVNIDGFVEISNIYAK